MDFLVLLTVQTMNYLHSGRHRVALYRLSRRGCPAYKAGIYDDQTLLGRLST